MSSRPRRTVALDLSSLASSLHKIPEPNSKEMEVAKQAKNLVLEVGEYNNGLSARFLAGIAPEVWEAAHDIAEGGIASPALRGAVEQIDAGAFDGLTVTLGNVKQRPDPAVAEEFI